MLSDWAFTGVRASSATGSVDALRPFFPFKPLIPAFPKQSQAYVGNGSKFL